MKKLLPAAVVIAIIATGIYVTYSLLRNADVAQGPPNIVETQDEPPPVSAVVENLTIPWDIEFLLGGEILITERTGSLLKIGEGSTRIPIEGVEHVGEGGLLGIALHPEFQDNSWIYLYLTTASGDGLINRVERYELIGNSVSDKTTILDNIPGARFHDGGRIAFGPDGFLYITTGDAGSPENSQNTGSLAGKILRVKDDGSIPEDNPFGNEIYSYGHRNPQGLTWDDSGNLWSTEHGRSGIVSGLDELNLIKRGENYGWPDSQGDTVMAGTISPILHSGPDTTWAPASALWWDGSIFFGGLKGEALYEAVIDNEQVVELRKHFEGEFGRIRTVALGPDEMFYITTSNRDGRGDVLDGDDKIVRINPAQLR